MSNIKYPSGPEALKGLRQKSIIIHRGQSLFELVFAIAIATIILLGIVSLATVSVRNSSSSRDNALANRYAQEGVEWFRQLRDDADDWLTFVTHFANGKTWCLDESPPPATPSSATGCTEGTDEINDNTIYLREALLFTRSTIRPNDTVEIEVKVRWEDSQGDHFATHSSKLTDWQ